MLSGGLHVEGIGYTHVGKTLGENESHQDAVALKYHQESANLTKILVISPRWVSPRVESDFGTGELRHKNFVTGQVTSGLVLIW